MSFSKIEEKIIKRFYCYVRSDEITRNDVYTLKWKNGTEIVASYYTSGNDDNCLEPDDPDYEEYTSFIMDIKEIINFNDEDGINLDEIKKYKAIIISYHNFPDEIYNSKGELISKRKN